MLERLDYEYPVRKSEFAKMAGVTPGAITQAINSRKSNLDQALKGKLIDANHPCAIEYLENNRAKSFLDIIREHKKQLKNVNDQKKEIIKKVKKPSSLLKRIPVDSVNYQNDVDENSVDDAFDYYSQKTVNETLMQVPHSISAYMDYTLRDIYEQFGTSVKFLNFLKSTQIISTINEKNLKNAVLENKLVSRESVEKNFFDPVNAAHLKLMTDGAKNIAATVKSKVVSGASDAEIENKVSQIVSTFIKPVKSKMQRALKDYKEGATTLETSNEY